MRSKQHWDVVATHKGCYEAVWRLAEVGRPGCGPRQQQQHTSSSTAQQPAPLLWTGTASPCRSTTCASRPRWSGGRSPSRSRRECILYYYFRYTTLGMAGSWWAAAVRPAPSLRLTCARTVQYWFCRYLYLCRQWLCSNINGYSQKSWYIQSYIYRLRIRWL